jgi:hypothetical protein
MTEWRNNAFASRCCQCGLRLEPNFGFYRKDLTGRNIFYCLVHKEDYDEGRLPTETPDRFGQNAATPTKVEIENPEQLAQRTADLTFDKVADHFTRTVPPMVEQRLDTFAGMVDSQVNEIPTIVRNELAKLVRIAEIKVGKAPPIKLDKTHKMLPLVLTAIVNGGTPFLVGPAGSGKSTIPEQIAVVLKLKFYSASRVTSEFKLLGFVDAHGVVVRTPFREAYESGGVFCLDELDACDPEALTSFNTAFANDYCDFPDGLVKRHKNFHAVATGNTYGRGADRQYVGRNQLDAATLDRFQVFNVDYDEQLETEIAGNLEWSTYVQQVRRTVDQEKIRHIVSPRASITGARFLAGGMQREEVEDACIWKGAEDIKVRVKARMTAG